MDQFTRRIIGFAVRAGAVDGPATCRMFNQAIAAALTRPRHLSSDHDPLFEFHRWKANLRILGVTEIKTVPEVPLSHPFIERLVGTVRRELLDQIPFWSARRSRTEAAALQGLLQPRSRSCVVGLDARSAGYQHRTQTTRPAQVPVGLLLQRSVSAPGSCLTIIRHRQVSPATRVRLGNLETWKAGGVGGQRAADRQIAKFSRPPPANAAELSLRLSSLCVSSSRDRARAPPGVLIFLPSSRSPGQNLNHAGRSPVISTAFGKCSGSVRGQMAPGMTSSTNWFMSVRTSRAFAG